MNIELHKIKERPLDVSVVYIATKETDFSNCSFSTTELEFIKKQIQKEKEKIDINSYFKWSHIRFIKLEEELHSRKEKMRQLGADLSSQIKQNEQEEIVVEDLSEEPEMILAFTEGLILSQYKFSHYKSEKKEESSLKKIHILSEGIQTADLSNLHNVCKAVFKGRDLVNEPLSTLNATELANRVKEMGREAGFSVEIFNQKKIETLKLNGLLAVNKGSIDPPSFSVLEWKPGSAANKKPIVLVGKGIVYDTGGISLKPSSFMTTMKSDMAGAATVAGILYMAASNELPIHLIGLIPATDNRPDGNAYVPDDIITMHNGKTVEIINTDAEGRMIMADALSFAKQYDPELVFDFATLTGSASRAIGPQGIVAMSTAEAKVMDKLKESGLNTHERIVELPLWEEYGEMIKSEVADIKNAGGKEAGAITAGKFLEHFINYRWVHLDIAPTAFLEKKDSYRGKGGTGIGIRLLNDFLQNYK
jgi:leucyl aminopeptidase